MTTPTTPRPGDVPVAYKELTPLGPTAPVRVQPCDHDMDSVGFCEHCKIDMLRFRPPRLK